MNLEKLLAENMLRFGTKNLSNDQIRKILKEQLQSPKPLKVTNLPAAEAVIANPGPNFKRAIAQVSSLFSRNKIPFSTNSAAAYYTMWHATMLLAKKQRKLNKLSPADLSKEIEGELEGNMPTGFLETIELQFNESKDEPGKALTIGVVTRNGIQGNDPGAASDVLDIIIFCNDYNLGELLATVGQITMPYDQINIEPMQLQGNKIMAGSFYRGTNGLPGVGSLDLDSALTGNSYDTFYSQTIYKAGSGISAGTTTKTIYVQVGPETVASLPKTLFDTGKIKLSTGAAEIIKQTIEDVRKLGTITGLRIESGASYDRPVESPNTAAFAKMVEVPADMADLPLTPNTETKQGVVTDPKSGGNAFLAIYRAKALASAIGNTAGVTPTIVAKVEKGGDAAQYVKLYYTVQKPDDTQVLTADDLKNLNAGSTTTALGGQFKVAKFSSLQGS
jgi:hypothetical protein